MAFFTAAVLIFQLSAAQQAALKVRTAQATAVKESSSSQAVIAAPAPEDEALPNAPRPAEAALSSSAGTAEKQASPVRSVSAALPDSSDSLAGIRIAAPGAPPPPFQNGTEPVVVSRRLWLSLSLAQHGAATFDAWSTRRSVARGNRETDPMIRPFAGSPAIYGVIQVGPAVLDFLGRRMQRSQNRWMHRMWWLPQSLSTAGFLYSGAHNLSVTR